MAQHFPALVAQAASVIVFSQLLLRREAPPHYFERPLSMLLCFASWITLVLLVTVTLFCVSVLSGDVAYLFMRLGLRVPEQEVWTTACRRRWVVAWFLTWLMQAPLWLHALPTLSPLIIHEFANLVLTVYHIVLKVPVRAVTSFGLPVPSVSLVNSSESGPPNTPLCMLGARCSLPLLYVVMNGVPREWKQALCCFVLDLAPVLLTTLALGGRRWPWERCPRPPWELTYAVTHPDAEDDCEEHGICPICLVNLCCPDSCSVAGATMRVRRCVAPALAAARRRPVALARAAGLSAARCPSPWFSSQIAVTRCGHSFHASCLSLSAESQPRCPQCRLCLTRSEFGTELPDEETMDYQILSLLFGFILGTLFLIAHWLLWNEHSPWPLVESTLRSIARSASAEAITPSWRLPLVLCWSLCPILILRWLRAVFFIQENGSVAPVL